MKTQTPTPDHIMYANMLGGDIRSMKQFALSDGTMVTSVKIPFLDVGATKRLDVSDKIFAVYNNMMSCQWVMWMIHRSSYKTVTIEQTKPGDQFPNTILYEPWMGHWPPVVVLVQRMVDEEDVGIKFFSNERELLISVNPFLKEGAFFN